MARVKYLNRIEQVSGLTPAAREELKQVTRKYKFRANDYYLGLINWDNPHDPIRRIIIPQVGEMVPFGCLDASYEEGNYVAPGTQHKYSRTVVLLCNEVCGAYCRFCFRKRLFMDENEEAVNDVSEGIEYIRRNTQVTNVLLTGGDPLLMSTRRLAHIIRQLREIDHVGIIRIGSKMPAFNPFRITDDPDLLAMFAKYSTAEKKIYLMAHFNVVEELTAQAIEAMHLVQKAGVITVNQTPLIGGVNDHPDRLADLMRKLSFIGVPPYYVFQCRPTEGNRPFAIPLVRGYRVFRGARKKVSGLAKRARLVMSHASGKIEIVGLTEHRLYMRYHRAKNADDDERFMIFRRDNNAYWLDDLVPVEPVPHRAHWLEDRPT
ncbi:MAG: KamA family radical SAM protein [candidate division Zixibacteria bacterium]|nr:KamA family radical SAM protein [candidate division Zixibacteria bacterium]